MNTSSSESASREARLAAKLRENLRRRKAQERARGRTDQPGDISDSGAEPQCASDGEGSQGGRGFTDGAPATGSGLFKREEDG